MAREAVAPLIRGAVVPNSSRSTNVILFGGGAGTHDETVTGDPTGFRPGTMYGRERERAAIEALCAAARAGRGGGLVLRGGPGIGKSALLDHAADGMRVLRATGVETEKDLAFSGLHQLLRPVLDHADRLPAPQSRAIRRALGLALGPAEDHFLVALAALTLLTEAAADGPLLCLVDDAHLLDRPSAAALAFVARRLDTERVAFLIATRERPAFGLPELTIGGLERSAAAALLRAHSGDLPAAICDRLVEQTGGHPLALVELSAQLTLGRLTGREPLTAPPRLSERVQHAFLDEVRRLPAMAQRIMLIAAVDDTGAAATIFRAGHALGVPAGAHEPLVRAGLVQIDAAGRWTFRHPLVRAAVYHGATFATRLDVHRTLAGVLDGDEHTDRRAWHLAAASTRPDEKVVDELAHVARRARGQGGHAVASRAAERAAQLCAEPADRARMLAAAARAACDAVQLDRAIRLARQAELHSADPIIRARMSGVRGAVEYLRGAPAAAHRLFITAAGLAAGHDPALAAFALVRAAYVGMSGKGDAGGRTRMEQITAALGALALPPGDPLAPLVTATIGVGDMYAGRVGEGVAHIRASVAELLAEPAPDWSTDLERRTLASQVPHWCGDDRATLTIVAEVVAHCRTRGLVGHLAFALLAQATAELLSGRHTAASAGASEGLRLARDLGMSREIGAFSAILAWLRAVRGDETECRDLAADAFEAYQAAQADPALASWALGTLELSLGRPALALGRLLDLGREDNSGPLTGLLIVPDLVEGAVRAGHPDKGGAELARFEDWAAATGQPWAGALLHRCRALLTPAAAERHFSTAVRLHVRAAEREFDQARTRLLYGEWLRRARRRADARPQLAAAHEIFAGLQAGPWADRAAAELRATGESLRSREETGDQHLTPQELQVLRPAARGETNREIGTRLQLSPRTVAYHLSKAFPKLGIASRRELAGLDLDAFTDR